MTEETQQPQSAQQAAAGQPQDSSDLTVSDLNSLKTIIDIASSRGAFKPNEMIAVGTIYNKLSNFLTVIAKQPQTGA